MNNTGASEGFKACPKCFSPIDVVVVRGHETHSLRRFFFVNCDGCGEGTGTAFSSMQKLKHAWNAYVDKSQEVALF